MADTTIQKDELLTASYQLNDPHLVNLHHEDANQGEYIFRAEVPTIPIPEKITLPEFVLAGAGDYADKVALIEVDTGKSLTYGEVLRDTKRFARALRSPLLGLVKGDVVVVALPNLAIYPVVALGVMAAGGVFSGVNPAASTSEMEKQVVDSEAKFIVTSDIGYQKVKNFGVKTILVGNAVEVAADGYLSVRWDELMEAAAPLDHRSDPAGVVDDEVGLQQSDTCALPYSSGTTGVSKGVILTHRNLVANLCSTLKNVGSPEVMGKETTLGLMPFFHIYGTTGICCATLRMKGKVAVMGRFEIRVFMKALVEHGVTFAPVVPAIMLAMVKSPVVVEFDLGRLKLKAVMTAAAPLAPEILAAFEAKYPGVVVQEAYGMTEHSCITLTHGDPKRVAKKNSVGRIIPNLEVKFVDPDTGRSLPKDTPGELCVRSQAVMQGYYKNKEETERAIDGGGWLHTGDIGYIDADGDVFIVDRIKELIKYKGFQVAPAELEAILLSHPSVQDAAVFALPDEEAGEVPAACVVVDGGAKGGRISEEEVAQHVAKHVASYKKIRVVRFVDSIPKSPSGKIMRRSLRDSLLRKIEARAAASTSTPNLYN